MIHNRRQAREAAVQILFAMDAAADWSEEFLSLLCGNFFNMPLGEQTVDSNFDFSLTLVRGYTLRPDLIDESISQAATNWTLSRMSRIDRSILRAASSELKFHPDIPKNVIINEALEIAKRFSNDDAILFINGVLERAASGRSEPLLAFRN